MIRGPKKSISIQLPEQLYILLKEQAEQDGHSLSAEIRQILRGYLEYIGRGGVSWCGFHAERGVEKYIDHDV